MIVRIAEKSDVSRLRKLDAKDTFLVKELNEFHTVLDDNEFLNFFLKTKSVFVLNRIKKIKIRVFLSSGSFGRIPYKISHFQHILLMFLHLLISLPVTAF